MKSDGKVFPKCAVETAEGVKVPDVAWASSAFFGIHSVQDPYTAAPELCIEVHSPSITIQELSGKRLLYFQRGAHEVWICDLEGHVTFFAADDEIDNSHLFPEFPKQVDVDSD